MFAHLLQPIISIGHAVARTLHRHLLAATRPAAAPLVVGALADLARSKPTLIAANALLRHQLVILQRSVKRPRCPLPTGRCWYCWPAVAAPGGMPC